MMMATYYQKPSWEQNYNAISYDSTFTHDSGASLTPNTYDISSGDTMAEYFCVPIRNTSPHSQGCVGITFWAGLFSGSPTGESYEVFNMTDGRTLGTSKMGTTITWTPNSTTDIELCRNSSKISGMSLSANTAYAVKFDYGGTGTIDYGTHYPSRIFYPFGLMSYVPGLTQLWRSNFTMPIHTLISDQIRWFEPSIPPRFIVYQDGTQLDEFWSEGWNPELSEYCLSGYLHDTSTFGLADWTTYPHHFLLPRDYNYISDLSGVTPTTGIDEDINFKNWYGDVKELEIEYKLTINVEGFDLVDNQELAVCSSFNWNGNGLKDYIMVNIKNTIDTLLNTPRVLKEGIQVLL